MLSINDKEYSTKKFFNFSSFIEFISELSESHNELLERVSLLEGDNPDTSLRNIRRNTQKRFRNKERSSSSLSKKNDISTSRSKDEGNQESKLNDDNDDTKKNTKIKEANSDEGSDSEEKSEEVKNKEETNIKKEDIKNKEDEMEKNKDKDIDKKKEKVKDKDIKDKEKERVREKSIDKTTKEPEENINNFLEDIPVQKINKSRIDEIKKQAELSKEAEIAPDKASSPELLKILFKRMFVAEKQIEELNKNSNSFSESICSLQNNDKKILAKLLSIESTIKKQNEDNDRRYYDSLENVSKIKRSVLKLEKKQSEFNIADLIKDSGNGSIDGAKLLIEALKKEIERELEKKEQSITDLNNELLKLQKIVTLNKKSISDTITRFTDIKQNFDSINKNYNSINDKINASLDSQKNTISENHNLLMNLCSNLKREIQNLIKDKENEMNQKIDKINSILDAKPKEDEIKQNKKDLELAKQFSDLQESLRNTDNAVQKLLSSKEVDEIKKKIKLMDFEISNKLTHNDLNEIYDLISKNKDGIQDDRDSIDLLNDENRKRINEIQGIWRNLENCLSSIETLKTHGRRPYESQNNPLDITKFIDNVKFMESTKALYKEIDRIKKASEDNCKEIFNIRESIRQFITNEQMEILENKYKNLFNDYKVQINKKYADKIEMNRNVKILEAQIKSLSDENGKKELSENWLLAKRPLNGYKCASCEADLDGLPNHQNEYLPWKKYPVRDNEKAYRVGSGFSHILQMMSNELVKNFENKESGTFDTEKVQITRCHSGNRKRMKLNNSVLPKVKLNKGQINLIEEMQNYSEDEMNNIGNTYSSNVMDEDKRIMGLGNPKIMTIKKVLKRNLKSEQ